MKNKVYEIMHPNTGKKLTERSRGPYQDYADVIDDDYGVYDGDYSVYDELDITENGITYSIFTEEEIEEYILEEKIYSEFSQYLYGQGYRFREWYKTYSETYDVNFSYNE